VVLTYCQVIIIGSHHDKSASFFWSVARRLPTQENPVVAWKFCHVVHKLLRDGHQTVSIDSDCVISELAASRTLTSVWWCGKKCTSTLNEQWEYFVSISQSNTCFAWLA